MFKLPIALSSLFGKKLHKDGRIEKCDKDNIVAIKKWYEETRRFLPEGTILLQSSTSHSLPYPAYLYGKATWAAIDILFFMPDQPITFMGEIDGEIYKVGGDVTTLFQHDQKDLAKTGNEPLKRSNSQLMMALTKHESNIDVDIKPKTLVDQTGNLNVPEQVEQRRGLPKVRSGNDLSQLYIEAEEGKIDNKKEEKLKVEFVPEKGFDLSKINSHYQHRRKLRKSKMVLRYGDLVHLTGRDINNNYIPDVLCYARYSLMESLLICTNLNDQMCRFCLDTSNITPIF